MILALENLIIEMLTLPTNSHAIQGRSTLKDKSERQFWNGTFRELKERIYYEVHEQSMGTSWWHNGSRIDCKLLYWSQQLSCWWMPDES